MTRSTSRVNVYSSGSEYGNWSMGGAWVTGITVAGNSRIPFSCR